MSKLTLALLVLCACVAVSMAAPQLDLEPIVSKLTPVELGKLMLTLASLGESSDQQSSGGTEGTEGAAGSS